MKYCSKCGKEIHDDAVMCIHCGCSVKGGAVSTQEEDAPSIGFAILGFFIPVIGLILWLIWKDKTPLKAKSAGKGALIGFCVSLVFSIIYGAIVGAMIGSMGSYYY